MITDFKIFPNNAFETAEFWCIVGLTTISQPAITCSKLTIETLEQGVKYVQS